AYGVPVLPMDELSPLGLTCDFCTKPLTEVNWLGAGRLRVCICTDCFDSFNDDRRRDGLRPVCADEFHDPLGAKWAQLLLEGRTLMGVDSIDRSQELMSYAEARGWKTITRTETASGNIRLIYVSLPEESCSPLGLDADEARHVVFWERVETGVW